MHLFRKTIETASDICFGLLITLISTFIEKVVSKIYKRSRFMTKAAFLFSRVFIILYESKKKQSYG